MQYQNGRDNLILAALPEDERRRLLPLLDPVEIETGKHLIEPDQPIRHIYFPIDLVTSTLQDLSDGASVEIGLMSIEGVIGIQF